MRFSMDLNNGQWKKRSFDEVEVSEIVVLPSAVVHGVFVLTCKYREQSTDEHLQLLLSHLNTCSGNDTATNVATEFITQVGKQLLDNHAVLLSQVYDDLNNFIIKAWTSAFKKLVTSRDCHPTFTTCGAVLYKSRVPCSTAVVVIFYMPYQMH